MFSTKIGIGQGRDAFLRPETAQGIFTDFHLLYRYKREKLPFGVIQIGKGYRNEVSPRQGIIRLRKTIRILIVLKIRNYIYMIMKKKKNIL